MKLDEILTVDLKKEAARLTKNARYDDSTDFEDAAAELEGALNLAVTIINSPAWKDWMHTTTMNYNVDADKMNDDLRRKIIATKTTFDALYDSLVNIDD